MIFFLFFFFFFFKQKTAYEMLRSLVGSEKAARENLTAVLGALEHALHMIAAEGHG